MLLLLGAAAALCLYGLLRWRFESIGNITYGSAQWAYVWDVFRRGHFRDEGLMVGDWTGQLTVYYNGIHAITFGHSGSGKGVSAILPNLLSYRWFFLVDPGGENTAIASFRWRLEKIPFACINFFGMHGESPWYLPVQGFNPLDALDAKSQAFAADALVFAEMLTPRSGNEGGSSGYFKDAAESAKQAMLVHIKTAEPAGRQNLATLYDYANLDAKGWRDLLKAMRSNPACGGLAMKAASRLERIGKDAPPEFSAIMSTIQQDLSFLADPLVRDMLSRRDVDFSMLKGLRPGQSGGVISVILPLEYMETHAAITRLALACAILAMERKPLAENKVVFLIDEAATLGRVSRFPNWLATLRKYQVVIWSIWQNMGQLVDLYGKGWQTLMSNCGLIQILGVGDLETAQHTEQLLGETTVGTVTIGPNGQQTISETRRPLLMKDELRRLSEDEEIVFIGNLPPMLLRKTPYWERESFAGLYNPNPYRDGAAPQPGIFDTMQKGWGRFYYGLVWWMTPHPVAAYIMLLLLTGGLAMLFR